MQRRLTCGASLCEVAEENRLTVKSLRRRLTRQGLQLPPGPKRNPHLWDEAWIRRAYVTDQRPTRAIAAELGASTSAVNNALLRYGIRARSRGARRVPVDVDLHEVQRLRDEGWTVGRIAARYGLTETALRSRLSRRDVRIQPRRPSIDGRLYNGDWLRHRYLDDGRTLVQIAQELRCGHTAVWRALRRFGINCRTA